ncbi:MAG: enoyl-CoA hydratase [Rhodospirillaceae bacterium]|nr:enoyl-CoA hydratase [Rhodospirillaceae bacterium]
MKEITDGKVLTSRDGSVLTVTVNRPEVRNACDMETVRALHRVFVEFEADDSLNVAVLTGTAGNFCAGADLGELASGASIGFCWAGEDGGVTQTRPRKPLVAAVEGYAVAAGLALAVWCDLRVVSKTAVFGVFCRRFGGPMPNGATVRLPRIVGESRALHMMMTGRAVDADEAIRIGLADRLVDAGEALSAAQNLAHEMAAFPQMALRSDRWSVIDQWNYPEDEAIRLEIEGSRPTFHHQFQAGAGRFVDGIGRHGKFDE